jgi:LEA14-like dessication related protein
MRLPGFVAAGCLVALIACSKPDPPVLTPKSARVTQVSLAGVDLMLDVEAMNPNAVELAIREVSGKVVLDGKYDLGIATVAAPIRLPAGARTEVAVPMALTWKDVSALATLAASSRAVPFTVDGTVNVGGERLNVDVPFHLTGTLTHDDLVKAAQRSLPGLPGLAVPR